MDADEAERVGLVSRVMPAKDLELGVLDIAEKIADKSLLTILAIKESIKLSEQTNLSTGILFERRKFHSLFGKDDQKEGMAAFIEKRAAKFTDK